jgi:hypothetical protein
MKKLITILMLLLLAGATVAQLQTVTDYYTRDSDGGYIQILAAFGDDTQIKGRELPIYQDGYDGKIYIGTIWTGPKTTIDIDNVSPGGF